MKSLGLWLLSGLLATTLQAGSPETKTTEWNGFRRLDFPFEDTTAILVEPKTPTPGKPWIWRTEFFGHEPQGDLALAAAGWHVAYVKVSDQYGAPVAIERMARFQEALEKQFGLAPKAVLEGFSRGGLYAVNYAAAHPAKVAGVYVDAPVLDLRSWPGGKGKGKGDPRCWKQVQELYGFTDKEMPADFAGNPLEKAEQLAKLQMPILAICGDADDVVPLAENTACFQQRFEAAGGKSLQVILKPGVGHHPHSLKDPAPIVEFAQKVWSAAQK